MSFRPKRLSDVVTIICFPVAFILCIYGTLLSRDLTAISNAEGYYDEITAVSEFRNSKLPIETVTIQSVLRPPLNNTVTARQDLLLLTPILRSGASSIRKLLKDLKSDNDFIIIAPTPKDSDIVHVPNRDRQSSAAHKMSSINQTSAVIDSFAFINFTEFGFQQPIQVSMVRDPLERAISWYYYIRAPYQVVERHKLFPEKKLPSRKFLKKSLESCLMRKNDPECHYLQNQERLGHTVEFFCGHQSYCKLFANEEGLKRAMEVVENSFAVVAIAEQWEKSVVVLEHLIPRFFKGAFKLIQNPSHEKLPNRNMYKPEVKAWARSMMKDAFSLEDQFYNFLLRRLNKQYEAIIKLMSESR